MRCPVCGAENGADFKFCRECAHPLKPQNTQINEPSGTQYNAASSDIEDFIIGHSATNETTRNDRIPDDFYSEFGDDDDFEPVIENTRPARPSGNNIINNSVRRVSFFDDDEEEDDDDEIMFEKPTLNKQTSSASGRSFSWDDNDDDDYEPKMKRKEKTRSIKDQPERSHKGLIIGIITTTVLVFVIAIFAFFLIKNYEGDPVLFFNTVFGSDPITKPAVVTLGEDESGEPSVFITVYARKNMMVHFKEGATEKTATVEHNYIKFCIPQSLWVPNEPVDGNSVTVKPNITVTDPKTGATTPVDVPSFELLLPAATINIISPETSKITTDSDSIEISGTVSDPTASVFLNGQQLQTTSDGFFITVEPLTELGDHEMVIEARKAGMANARYVIHVTYTKDRLDIEIDDEYMLRTFDDTIEVSGRLKDKGATLSVEGIEHGEIKLNSETGAFSFTAKVPDVRLYIPTLKVTYGDVTTERTIYIEHAPDMDSYVRSARDFDYDRIVSKPTMAYKYEVRGTIVEVLQTEPYVIAKMLTRDNHYITFNYYTPSATVEANDGKTYRIYAENTSLDDDGNPVMHCWFVYKK